MTPRRRGRAKAGRPPGWRDRLDAAIVGAAIDLAWKIGWDGVRLPLLADRLGIPAAELRRHFRDPAAIADAFFGRAADAVVGPMGRDFSRRPAPERLALAMGRWFETLAPPHRRVAVQMLRGKLYPAHPHHWLPLIFHLSRLIQLVRAAAGLEARGPRRQAEEVGLTALFVVALAVWANDATPAQARTRRVLSRGLGFGEAAMVRLFGKAEPTRRTGPP